MENKVGIHFIQFRTIVRQISKKKNNTFKIIVYTKTTLNKLQPVFFFHDFPRNPIPTNLYIYDDMFHFTVLYNFFLLSLYVNKSIDDEGCVLQKNDITIPLNGDGYHYNICGFVKKK